MISRGRVLAAGLALCALAVYAFGAVGASASQLTAVTCKFVGPGGHYNNSHCGTPESPGEWETEALPLNQTTEVTSKNTEAEPTLRATIGGANFTVICENGEGVGADVKNTEPETGKHTVTGTGVTTLSGCHAVLKTNEARYCSVEGITAPGGKNMISTVALAGMNTGVEHKVKLEPEAGGVFTEFNILKKGSEPATENECWTTAVLKVIVAGALEGEANTENHSHATFTEENNGTSLKVGGSVAKFLTTLGGFMKGTENTVGAQTFT